MVDPFSAAALKDDHSHPWAEFQSDSLFIASMARLYRESTTQSPAQPQLIYLLLNPAKQEAAA